MSNKAFCHCICLALCFLVATSIVSPRQGHAAKKLPRGWKGATLDISVEALKKAIAENKHEETSVIVAPASAGAESLDDTYHLGRYFSGKFDFPKSIDELHNEQIQCSIVPDTQCQFTQFRKVSFPGTAFHLEGEGVHSVVFWQDVGSKKKNVLIVEYVLKSKKHYADLRAKFENAYGAPAQVTRGKHWLIADTLSWHDDHTFLKLCETRVISQADQPDRYALVFGDSARTKAAQTKINQLLQAPPAKGKQSLPASPMLVVQSFNIDEKRCSFEKKEKYGYTYYDWKWSIIEQQINPNIYLDRFREEANKPYFNQVFAYFSQRAQQQPLRCQGFLASKELVWRLPFQPNLNNCPTIFPTSEDLETLRNTQEGMYNSMMHWYSQGFGIPFPVFNILVYNPGNTEVLITHLSYQVKKLDQLLPGIINEPPLGPFEQVLDVTSSQIQTIPLSPNFDGLSVPAHQHRSFSIKLKSNTGIGHVCKVDVGIVVKRGGEEQVVHDEKLVFVTVLSSTVIPHQ